MYDMIFRGATAMTDSRTRFEAHMASRTGCDSCSATNTEAHWLTWQARDAEVADLQAEADAWRANARDSGVEARKYKAELERLVDALRDARDTLCSMNAEYAHNLINRIDALLREYDKEKP